MRKLILPFVFVFLLTNINAQTISDYLSVPFPTELKSSADGKKIAWVFNDKGSRNIYVAEAPLFQGKAITKFSGDDGLDINSLQFNPDGTQLVFVQGNPPNSRGEAANPALLQTPTGRTIWIAVLSHDSTAKNW